MKTKYLGMFCLFGVIYGAFMLGYAFETNGIAHDWHIDSGALLCLLINGSVLGSIVWDAPDRFGQE